MDAQSLAELAQAAAVIEAARVRWPLDRMLAMREELPPIYRDSWMLYAYHASNLGEAMDAGILDWHARLKAENAFGPGLN